ncbi:uncharacterized protein LOC144584083 [Pogona vitticeps]
MEPDVLHSHRSGGRPLSKPRGPVAPQPSRAPAKGLRKVAHGGLSTLYLHLLSLRMGLLGWCFCLKQTQWNFLCWVHASLELATDIFFCWVQNALVACVMLLLLAWKAFSEAKALGASLSRALSVLKSWFWKLVWIIWTPAFCAVWMTWCFIRLLEVSYKQAARMAEEDEEDQGGPPAAAQPPSPGGLVLRRKDGI